MSHIFSWTVPSEALDSSESRIQDAWTFAFSVASPTHLRVTSSLALPLAHLLGLWMEGKDRRR